MENQDFGSLSVSLAAWLLLAALAASGCSWLLQYLINHRRCNSVSY